VFMQAGETSVGTDALLTIYARPSAGGTLACYEKRIRQNEQHAQTAQLKTAFSALANPILARYTDLAGSGIVTSLRHDLNDLARANQWRVLATLDGFTDTHSFETPEAAARAYAILIKAILTHMSAIVGARLANTILRETVQQLDPADYDLVQTYHVVSEIVFTGRAK